MTALPCSQSKSSTSTRPRQSLPPGRDDRELHRLAGQPLARARARPRCPAGPRSAACRRPSRRCRSRSSWCAIRTSGMSHSAIARSSTSSSPKRSGGSGIEGMSRLDRTLPGVSPPADQAPTLVLQGSPLRPRAPRADHGRPRRAPSRSCCRSGCRCAPPRRRSPSCGPGSTGGWPRSAASGRPSLARGDTLPYLGQTPDRACPSRGARRVAQARRHAAGAGRSGAPCGARALVPADGARGDPRAAGPRLRDRRVSATRSSRSVTSARAGAVARAAAR